MLLALALYASTAHAGIPTGFGGTLGVVNENMSHYGPRVIVRRRGAGVKGQDRGGPGHRRVSR